MEEKKKMRWNENGKSESEEEEEADLTGRRVGFRRRMLVAVGVIHNSSEMEKNGDEEEEDDMNDERIGCLPLFTERGGSLSSLLQL